MLIWACGLTGRGPCECPRARGSGENIELLGLRPEWGGEFLGLTGRVDGGVQQASVRHQAQLWKRAGGFFWCKGTK